jgi:hypothetical protein
MDAFGRILLREYFIKQQVPLNEEILRRVIRADLRGAQ